MRMMLKAVVDTEAGNEALRDGSVIKAIEQMVQELHPEAAYSTASDDGTPPPRGPAVGHHGARRQPGAPDRVTAAPGDRWPCLLAARAS